ncbi:penicillin-binding protein 1C [Thiothrix nivea]|uniref:peptidoglycan glycosyltransferase n=1 Tax=Thiothrix nivea (strain ATCC 35100 / DSM 5205 / JP2) TaxID=870187 RepID=A0A656H936_THINJ|nr:penicillin-binding protein 1C [Thiothrix nivea]EIJ33281.1 penicillin-binding protein 1C [Thiothrix nivea DSM 5205]
MVWKRVGRYSLRLLVAGVVCLLGFLLADRIWPLPDPDRVRSVLILAQDRTPLRAFADSEGVWRYPVTLDEVSPRYVQALLEYEDRWFYRHPGINPLALARAGWQWLEGGRVVSGGSTLTMQVARILDPHERTLSGKLRQMFRALQLEWHYHKDEILTFYLNLAPFGGPIEGVQTASFAWLHKPALELSYAEAALLAVLPQAPSRLRPDRHPELAQQYRDKVLRRMAAQGVWTQETVEDALREPVIRARFRQPMAAPLFAQRMKAQAFATQQARLQTALDANIQWALENVLRTRMGSLPAGASAGVLVVENSTGYVRGYAGSADFFAADRFGHVDMVQAVRSPGSTLKPFLYGMAVDDGLLHSASLLSDVPIRREDYAPQNFFRHFSGAVSLAQALQQSLNIPAVDVLQRLNPASFVARLRNGGVTIRFPGQAEPNLSVILGGAGTTLEDLVRGFTAFAREGVSIKPRFLPAEPLVERRMLSAGAAWIIQDILRAVSPPEGSVNHAGIAWKTGTSYGFRDAWAVGVSDAYTVGVWTGRPDGTPLPGRFGAYAAGPILFDIFRALPGNVNGNVRRRPDNVERVDICWPLGGRADTTAPKHCHVRLQAWTLDGRVPPTLPNVQQYSWSAGLQTYWVNPQTGLRVTSECVVPERVSRQVAMWPLEVQPWLADSVLEKMRLPGFDPACPTSRQYQGGVELAIRNLDASTRLYLPATASGQQTLGVTVDLLAQGGEGQYFWLVNGEPVGIDPERDGLRYTFTRAGDYDLTVFDAAGAVDKMPIRVVSQ